MWNVSQSAVSAVRCATAWIIAICHFTPALTRVFDVVPLSLWLSRGDSREKVLRQPILGVSKDTREKLIGRGTVSSSLAIERTRDVRAWRAWRAWRILPTISGRRLRPKVTFAVWFLLGGASYRQRNNSVIEREREREREREGEREKERKTRIFVTYSNYRHHTRNRTSSIHEARNTNHSGISAIRSRHPLRGADPS